MFSLARQFLIRLIILIIAISPVQITMAIDFDQHSQATTCQMSQEQPAEIMVKIMGEACKSDQDNHCVDLSVCSVQYNVSSLYSSGLFQLTARTVIHKKFIAERDAVSTQYPELLKRPPRIYPFIT